MWYVLNGQWCGTKSTALSPHPSSPCWTTLETIHSKFVYGRGLEWRIWWQMCSFELTIHRGKPKTLMRITWKLHFEGIGNLKMVKTYQILVSNYQTLVINWIQDHSWSLYHWEHLPVYRSVWVRLQLPHWREKRYKVQALAHWDTADRGRPAERNSGV